MSEPASITCAAMRQNDESHSTVFGNALQKLDVGRQSSGGSAQTDDSEISGHTSPPVAVGGANTLLPLRADTIILSLDLGL